LTTVSGEEILKVLAKDPRFNSMPTAETMALTPHILKLPEILGKDLLSTKVSLVSILKAKIAFVQYCLDNGLGSQVANNLLTSVEGAGQKVLNYAKRLKDLELPTTDVIAQRINRSMETIVGTLSSLLSFRLGYDNPIRYYSSILRAMHMSDHTINKCDKENLTIADLLLIEPFVFLFNASIK
jgi:hypothetical protein